MKEFYLEHSGEQDKKEEFAFGRKVQEFIDNNQLTEDEEAVNLIQSMIQKNIEYFEELSQDFQFTANDLEFVQNLIERKIRVMKKQMENVSNEYTREVFDKKIKVFEAILKILLKLGLKKTSELIEILRTKKYHEK